MALISYLTRVPQYEDTTLEEIDLITKYFDWGRRREEGSPLANCSLKEWCGVNGNELPHKYKVTFYREFYTLKSKYDEYFGGQEEIYSIVEQIARFPKANHIHNWFVENLMNGEQDTEYHKVTKEQLQKLLDDCMTVSDEFALTEDGEYIIDEDLAREILPTAIRGYFFGSEDYGDWYAQSVMELTQIVQELLETTDFESQTVYYNAIW